MRILITGGAGFIGSNLCDELIDHGDDIICFDNLSTGSRRNIEHHMNNSKFTFIKGDILNPIVIAGPIDQIYHLACPASPPHYQSDPINTIQICTIGTMNVLNLAQEKGARILLSSTSEVYGDPEVSPQSESYRGNTNTLGIRACYDEGKRISETLFMEYYRCKRVDVRIARIFNTYGPNMSPDDGRVVSNFITQAMTNKPITIYGDGSQSRSFCFVDDTVDGLITLMNQTDTIGPVNIGNPNEITMLELMNTIFDLIPGTQSIIKKMPLPEDDPKQRCPDITLAREVLGWEPLVILKEGLECTIQYFLCYYINN